MKIQRDNFELGLLRKGFLHVMSEGKAGTRTQICHSLRDGRKSPDIVVSIYRQ